MKLKGVDLYIMLSVDEIIKISKEYLKDKDEIIFAYLFGSYARGKARKSSDIDIAAYIKDLPVMDMLYITVEYSSQLGRLLNCQVDFVILNNSDPLLRHEVFSEGKLIIDKDHDLYVDFRVKSFYLYEDRKRFLDIYGEYLKERYPGGKERDS